jgi:hypothetical protein
MTKGLDLAELAKERFLKVSVKPGTKENNITGYDEEKKVIFVDIKERAVDNKANLEVVKFFSRLLKKKVRIKSGLRGKEKVLLIS